MPKMKTKSGASKRFRKTAGGYKFRRTNRNHILTKKPHKRKRQARGAGLVGPMDKEAIRRMLVDTV